MANTYTQLYTQFVFQERYKFQYAMLNDLDAIKANPKSVEIGALKKRFVIPIKIEGITNPFYLWFDIANVEQLEISMSSF